MLTDGLFFMCFVVRIFWQNLLAANSLLVSVLSRWNSWLEPFRFHAHQWRAEVWWCPGPLLDCIPAF